MDAGGRGRLVPERHRGRSLQETDYNPATAAPLDRFEFDEAHMGTKFTITLYAADKQTAITAVRAAFKRVRELEVVLSDYRADSEVMKLCAANDADPGKPRPVGPDLAATLALSLDVSAKSDGAFDVTVGPLSKLWREARKTKQLPDTAAAMPKVGYKKLTFDPAAKTLTMAVPGMRLDFGGVGKGVAADEALKALKANGVSRALVAASGDIAAGDPPPGRDAWKVEIAPIGTGRPARTVKLVNAAVSTSGDLYQSVEIAGVRYSHVLDPRTGKPLTGRRSVTIIAPTGGAADPLAKAASVLPADKALALIEATPGAALYMVVKESDAAAEAVTASKRFKEYE